MNRVSTVLALLVVVALSFLLVACGESKVVAPFKSVNVSARLESPSVESGGSTFLVVDAKNNGTLPLKGVFDIVPENNQVTVERRDDRFDMRPQDTAGQKRYNITGYANSISQQILITVRFNDTDTNQIVGSTSVILSVHK